MPQMLFEELGSANGFDLRSRDAILEPTREGYRLTAKDRAQLVQIAAQHAGPNPTSSAVNAALDAKVTNMLRPRSTREILADAAAVSPCKTFAVLPLDERAFYQFLNRRFSPSVRGVFLWENFHATHQRLKYISVFRETYFPYLPWWSPECWRVISEACRGMRIGSIWSSFGLTDETPAPLVAMFPERNRIQLLPDEWASKPPYATPHPGRLL